MNAKFLNTPPPLGLYVHYPFCESKCPYCDFVSFVDESSSRKNQYFETLQRELGLWIAQHPTLRGRPLSSIYFGGGTPSLSSPASIANLIEAARAHFALAQEIEITLEANPRTAEAGRFREFRSAGVNRLSIGIQSLEDAELNALGRTHSAAEAIQALSLAREAGFDNLSADLIFGIPGQTVAGLMRNLERLLEFRPEHLSVYGLTIYEGTEFDRLHRTGRLKLPSDDRQAEMFLAVRHHLIRCGYEHYEISNYALPGRASRHNRLYWTGGEWLGLGVSAHSSFAGKRWANVPALHPWHEALQQNCLSAVEEEMPTGQAAIGEAVMLGLRQSTGISLDAVGQRFGSRARSRAEQLFQPMIEEGLVQADKDRRYLTERGLLVADAIMRQFFL